MTTQLFNFHPQFADLVLSGEKRQTIRLIRQRNPVKAGDELRLYTGLRRPGARLLRVETCEDVQPIDFISKHRVQLHYAAYGRKFYIDCIEPPEILDCYNYLIDVARDDGFQTTADFVNFFVKRYGPLPIVGRLCVIYWTPTAEGLERAGEIMAERKAHEIAP